PPARRPPGRRAPVGGPPPRRGPARRDLAPIEDGALAARQGRIVWVGPEASLDGAVALSPGATVLDAGGAAVVPGFVDAHTTLAFAGDRDDENAGRVGAG